MTQINVARAKIASETQREIVRQTPTIPPLFRHVIARAHPTDRPQIISTHRSPSPPTNCMK